MIIKITYKKMARFTGITLKELADTIYLHSARLSMPYTSGFFEFLLLFFVYISDKIAVLCTFIEI